MDGTNRAPAHLLVMMAFGSHHPSVNFREFRIDLSGSIGRQEQCPFDTIIPALRNRLPGSFHSATVGSSRKEPTEATHMAYGMEAICRMQDAEQCRGKMTADAGNTGKQGLWVQLLRYQKFAVRGSR